jgi:tetratricopeptide (TPR) repeat protein
MSKILLDHFKTAVVFCLAAGLAFTGLAVDGATPNVTPAAPAGEAAAPSDTLRAYLQLQEQIHATQLSIERTREESQAADVKNSEALSNRLQLIENSLALQRKAELESVQSSNRFMFFGLCLFAIVGLVALALTAYFQWRAIHRLSEIAAVLPPRRAIGSGAPLPSVGLSEDHLITAGQVEQSNSRLFGIIERLEKRILELEHPAAPALKEPSASENPATNGEAIEVSAEPAPPMTIAAADRNTRLTFLLDKGQMLLDSDQTEEAVTCFDEALAMAPNHAEALVKKGAALEKLRKHAEAIECYDRAIAADSSLTIAYLYKGGLCNRLERFSEAVECYEQALRTQEKHAA